MHWQVRRSSSQWTILPLRVHWRPSFVKKKCWVLSFVLETSCSAYEGWNTRVMRDGSDHFMGDGASWISISKICCSFWMSISIETVDCWFSFVRIDLISIISIWLGSTPNIQLLNLLQLKLNICDKMACVTMSCKPEGVCSSTLNISVRANHLALPKMLSHELDTGDSLTSRYPEKSLEVNTHHFFLT